MPALAGISLYGGCVLSRFRVSFSSPDFIHLLGTLLLVTIAINAVFTNQSKPIKSLVLITTSKTKTLSHKQAKNDSKITKSSKREHFTPP